MWAPIRPIPTSGPATRRRCTSGRRRGWLFDGGGKMNRQSLWLSLVCGALAFALDRAHKHLQVDVMHWPETHVRPLLPFIDLTLVYNRGVSYSLLASLPSWAVAVVVAVALCALIVWWSR